MPSVAIYAAYSPFAAPLCHFAAARRFDYYDASCCMFDVDGDARDAALRDARYAMTLPCRDAYA